MKNYLILLVVLFLSTKLFAVSETVNLGTNPGTLSASLVNDPATVTDLTVIGQINYLDFQFMNASMTTLANVDLSGASIVEYVDNGVTYPANQIPNNAFLNKTSLVSVKLPTTTTRVGELAFKNCSNLETMDYGTSISTFGKEAFRDCTKLTTPPNNLPITNVGINAFYKTGITGALILEEGLTAIQDNAFHSCQNLTSVTLPSTITSIGGGVFAGLSGTTSNILTFNIYATTPPTLGANVFIRRNVNSVLHVPIGKKDTYSNAGTQWAQFTIIDDLLTTSVKNQKAENIQVFADKNLINISSDKEISKILIYDLNGKLLHNINHLKANSAVLPLATKGIFIINISLSNGYNESVKFTNI